MINTNTVFILGAGASKPYGFPTGEEFKNNILNMNLQRGINQAKLVLHPFCQALFKLEL